MKILTTGSLFFLCWIHYVSSDSLSPGDSCIDPSTNETGRCISLYQCRYVKEMRKKNQNPKICRFIEITPIVCCPTRENLTLLEPGTLSTEKCNSYYDMANLFTFVPRGKRSRNRDIPHMAAIGFNNNATGKIVWDCGGTIISNYFVLGAAHCAYSPENGAAAWVRVGVSDLNDTSPEAINRQIIRIFVHPFYKPPSYYHDVALFKLRTWVSFDYFSIAPACLHTEKNLPVEILQASGWGKVGFLGDKSTYLMKADLKLVDHPKCFKKFDRFSTRRLKNGILDKYQICAGDETGKDTCPGDSGGPLHYRADFTDDVFSHLVVAGITSFGSSCGGTNSAGVYVRVSTYVDWIETIVWDQDLSAINLDVLFV